MSVRARPRSDWFAPALLIGSAAYLYLNLFAFPAIPYLLGGDQVYFWMGAQRMMRGEQLYRDFFQFAAPGADLVYLAFFQLFGLHLWVANALVLALGVTLSWLCFSLSSRIMSRSAAFLAAWLFLVLLYVKPLNATHHWFSLLWVLLAVAILMKSASPRSIVAVGALLGLASFFTQTRGPIVGLGIAAYLVWEKYRKGTTWASTLQRIALLIATSIATLALLSASFIHSVGLRRLWYFQITYPRLLISGGREENRLGLPLALTLHNLPALSPYLAVYILAPVVYAFVLWRCWQYRRQPSNASREIDRVALLAFVGLAMTAEVSMSLNWLRWFCVTMPAFILFIWGISRSRLRVYGMTCIWALILMFAIHETWARRHQQYTIENLPSGRAAVPPEARERTEWLIEHTRPGQHFLQAPWPGVYLPMGLYNPVFLDAFERTKQTRPEFVELSIHQLEQQNVQYILWSHDLDLPDPRLPQDAYHIASFRDFLHSHYRLVQTFSNREEIWERR